MTTCLRLHLLFLIISSLVACVPPFAISQAEQLFSRANQRLVLETDWAELASEINERTSGPVQINRRVGPFMLQRSDEESLKVIDADGNAVLKTTIADGRRWEGHSYDRAALVIGFDVPGGVLDPKKMYVLEWRGYLEQPLSEDAVVLVALQIHGQDTAVPPLAVMVRDGYVNFRDRHDPTGKEWYPAIKTEAMVNQSVSFKLTVRSSDTNGYIKFEVDEQVITERQGGRTKNPGDWNYVKVAELYDFSNTLVSPDSKEGRSYSLITEEIRVSILE